MFFWHLSHLYVSPLTITDSSSVLFLSNEALPFASCAVVVLDLLKKRFSVCDVADSSMETPLATRSIPTHGYPSSSELYAFSNFLDRFSIN